MAIRKYKHNISEDQHEIESGLTSEIISSYSSVSSQNEPFTSANHTNEIIEEIEKFQQGNWENIASNLHASISQSLNLQNIARLYTDSFVDFVTRTLSNLITHEKKETRK